PVVGALSALALILLLRAGELTHERRSVRGGRPRDRVLLVALSPWYLVRSALGCLLLAPFALVAAAVAGLGGVALSPGPRLSRAAAAAAGTLVAFYGFGPGSARPRRQLSRLFAAVATGRAVQAVALAGMTALALATLAAAASWPSLYWPAGAPGGGWHFGLGPVGPIRPLGLVGRLLPSRPRRRSGGRAARPAAGGPARAAGGRPRGPRPGPPGGGPPPGRRPGPPGGGGGPAQAERAPPIAQPAPPVRPFRDPELLVEAQEVLLDGGL